MRAGLAFLVAGYVLSQFYRAFLAVLSPILGTEIGAMPGDLALSSGIWFLIFAVMQMPVGAALDRIGPRMTASVLLGLGGGGGALVFALAQGPAAVHLAMALIGIGCSPVLMASYYIFARVYSPAVFGTLAGAMIGRQIGENMDEVDRMKTARALNDSKTGTSTTWVNPDTGYEYTVTPTRTYEASGGPCREFRLDAEVGSSPNEEVYGTACLQADGSWLIQ